MKLKRLLEEGKFVVGSEVHVASASDPEQFIRSNYRFWDWADLLRLKIDGQDQSERMLRGLCRVFSQRKPALEIEVRTRSVNRLEIGRTLVNACNAGIENFLIFTQDYWISGDSVPDVMHFRVDMGKFFSAADAVREGRDVEGQALDGKKEFLVGAGVNPRFIDQPLEMQIEELALLADRGIAYFVTNPVFDLARFEKFVNRVAKLKVPVIAEVVMLSTADEARLLNSMSWIRVPQRVIDRLDRSGFHPEEPAAITIELIQRLRDLCAGVHVLRYGDVAQIAPVLKSLAGTRSSA